MKILKIIGTLLILGGVAACNPTSTTDSLPKPATLTKDDIGHSDQMIVVNHKGPKSQIHLVGEEIPLWFSSVRDGLAYLKSPERSAKILAFYVSDAGATTSWNDMGNDNWIDANDAFFVVGSDAIGGMGAPAFVPFSNEKDATIFMARRGGSVLKLSDISAEMVLTPVENDMMNMEGMSSENMNMNEAPSENKAPNEMVMNESKKSD